MGVDLTSAFDPMAHVLMARDAERRPKTLGLGVKTGYIKQGWSIVFIPINTCALGGIDVCGAAFHVWARDKQP